MAVRPVSYAADGGVTVSHDERGHGGAVAFVDVRFGRHPDGSVNPDAIEVTCPVCGETSTHPIGGGAAPGPVQKLFLRTIRRRAASLGLPTTFAAAKARVQSRADAMDGPGRFRLAMMTNEDDPVNGP